MKISELYLWLLFPLFLAGVYLLDFNGLYGQDAFEYYRCSCELFQPCHFPVLYPLYGKIAGLLGGEMMGLQMISLLAFTAILVILRRLIPLFYAENQEISIYLFLFGGLSAYFFRSAPLIMSDMLNAFFILGGLYFLMLSQKVTNSQNQTLFFAILSLLFLIQAVFTRYASGVLLLFYVACFPFFVMPRLTLPKNIILIIIGLFWVSVFVVLQKEFILQGGNHSHLLNWSFRNFFRSSFVSVDGNISYRFNNWLYGMMMQIHPGFCLLGGVFVFLFTRKSFSASFLIYLWFPIILYVLFLMGIPFQNTRFYLLTFPLWLILFYGPFLRVVVFLEKFKKKLLFYLLIFVIQGGMCYYSVQSTFRQNRLEKTIIQKMKVYSNAPVLYTLGMEGVLRMYKVGIPVTSLYYEKITNYPEGALLFIQTKVIDNQWKEKNPGENLNFIRNHYHTDTLTHFNGGWDLYRLHKK